MEDPITPPEVPDAADAIPDPIADAAPSAPPVIDTENTRLADGLNRCPKCGSTDIQLRVSTGMLVCLFCRHEWTEDSIEPLVSQTALDDLEGTIIGSGATDIDATAAGVLTMKCAGCGSEVVVNTAEATSSRCHWCRHVLTVNEQVPNGAVPDAVLPFGISREDALAKIRAFAGKRRLFAHRRFIKEFVPENVVGAYLPYMVIDGKVSAELHGQGEVLIRRYTRGTGDNKETYYDADVYQVERALHFTVDDLTMESAADRADLNTLVNTNNVINTILPFDTEKAVRWNANYLAGFTSERRNQDVAAMVPQLEHQLLSIARSQAAASVANYNRGVRWEAEGLDVHGTRWVSMYLPVWLYSYYQADGKKQGMVHYIAVNGRTGETMGSVPVSQARLLTAAIAVGSVLEAVALAVVAVAL